jgi:hypothetical protein
VNVGPVVDAEEDGIFEKSTKARRVYVLFVQSLHLWLLQLLQEK